MKICNIAAILILALSSTLSVEASSVPKVSHTSPIERGVDELYTRAGMREAFSGLTWKHYVAGAVGGAFSSAFGFTVTMGLILHNLPKGRHGPEDDQSGASPTNGRRSAMAESPAEDTHRNPVRREAVDNINPANPILVVLEIGSHKEAGIYSVQTRPLEYASTAKVLRKFPAASGRSGVVALNRRWSSVPVLSAVDSKHFDSKNAIRVALLFHNDDEPEKNANTLATRTMSPEAMFAICFGVGLPISAILGGATSAIIKLERHTQHHKRDVDLKHLELAL
ncbi:unnamed protein product [Tilletia controversa]|uniref:Uncharacterized protein n=2 Tax=Tilletia TaxID=13289 RepID=A0A8X7MT48_9BASI|nr:hypothetical protein CF335_g4944 [Tilletia laevis]KAE8198669.1 hypothetical protein CF328_g3485 [Tilletia controversa]CAD6940880.1 unnamed protein product [Tilletia caries]KAE8247779.1 hypothetical protein A4X06_0g4198 [Tilletia controversa]CAD6941907.1 unnamed protein product [Tilletia controversa]